MIKRKKDKVFIKKDAGNVEQGNAIFNNAMGNAVAMGESKQEGDKMKKISEDLDNIVNVEEKSREVVDPTFADMAREKEKNDKVRAEVRKIRKAPKSSEEDLPEDTELTLDESRKPTSPYSSLRNYQKGFNQRTLKGKFNPNFDAESKRLGKIENDAYKDELKAIKDAAGNDVKKLYSLSKERMLSTRKDAQDLADKNIADGKVVFTDDEFAKISGKELAAQHSLWSARDYASAHKLTLDESLFSTSVLDEGLEEEDYLELISEIYAGVFPIMKKYIRRGLTFKEADNALEYVYERMFEDPELNFNEEVSQVTESANIKDNIKMTLGEFMDNFEVIGPASRGEGYPEFDPLKFNEKNIEDCMRFKEYDIKTPTETEAVLYYITQEPFDDADSKSFIEEVKRAINAMIKKYGYALPFTLKLDVTARDGERYGRLEDTLKFNLNAMDE